MSVSSVKDSGKGSVKRGLGHRGTSSKTDSKANRGIKPRAASAEHAAPAAAGPRLGWREAITATVTGLGFDLVDVERAQRGLLRVTIDRQPGRNYTVASEFVQVEDCEQVTRQLQYALEVEGLEYARLEVSSPGLDRPLKTEADFERFSGVAVSITLKAPFQGRKVWQGVLGRNQNLHDSGSAWSLVFKVGKVEQALGFKFEEVREARLVPVVDFKGRKSSDSGPAGAAPEAVPGTDGGLENR